MYVKVARVQHVFALTPDHICHERHWVCGRGEKRVQVVFWMERFKTPLTAVFKVM